MWMRCLVCMLVIVALVTAPISGAGQRVILGTIATEGAVEVNGMPAKAGSTLLVGDRVQAHGKSLATLSLAGGDQVFLIGESSAQFIRDQQVTGVRLEKGALGVRHRSGEPAVVEFRGLLIRPANGQPARYLVTEEKGAILLSSLSGDVEVRGTNRTVMVPSGKSLRVEVAAAPQGPSGSGSASALSTRATIILALVIASAITAIAVPLALQDDEPVSPGVP